jgi:hypothetical protein
MEMVWSLQGVLLLYKYMDQVRNKIKCFQIVVDELDFYEYD